MLKTLQIIALLQGLLVLCVLFINRKVYKKTTFWLLFGSLLSVILYIAGDDDNNLIVADADWFLFDSSLFITFLFLFFRYYSNGKANFEKQDLLFFLPNLIYFTLEGLEIIFPTEILVIEVLELFIEFTFVGYLIFIIYSVIRNKEKYWIFYFALPITFLFVFSSINEVLKTFSIIENPVTDAENYNSYLHTIVAFLFYFIAFGLMNKKSEILPKSDTPKYRNSNLNEDLINRYKGELKHAMEVDKMYLNNKLSIHEVSEKLNIPRQYVSEILNKHMDVSFQDFVNQYRVDAFIERLQNDQNNHLTLFGIANEVGFNSKSSFNATFKKFNGLTPTQYKNSL